MLRRNKAPRRRGRRPRKAAFGLAQPFFHGIAGGERGRNPAFWALPVCAQFSYSFVRGAAVRLGVSAYQQPVFTPGEAPLRRVGDVGLSGPARSECRSLPKTGEWPVPSEPARMGPLAVRRRRRKPSGRHVFIRAELAGSSSNLSPFQSGMSSPGRIGRQLFPHGESDVRHVSGRVGHSFPAENRSCFCGQHFLRGGGSFCFSPKNRYHIDIAKVRGAKAAFSTSGVKRCRRRPRTF